ncbi:hypothetical protein V6N13_102713 [Hibiscus sabdariffa]
MSQKRNLATKILFLKDYRQTHPEVAVVDPPDAIQHLYNRHSMLQNVVDLNLSDFHGRVGVPRQMVIMKDPLSIPDEVAKAGLKLPLVAKPLLVDGSAKSHELFLLFDWSSLSKLEPPLVLQEFVNHGGILFKIYIVGDAIKVVRRFSLPNVTKCQLAKVPGIFPFPRVSSAAASADDADLDPHIAGKRLRYPCIHFPTSSTAFAGETFKGAPSSAGKLFTSPYQARKIEASCYIQVVNVTESCEMIVEVSRHSMNSIFALVDGSMAVGESLSRFQVLDSEL